MNENEISTTMIKECSEDLNKELDTADFNSNINNKCVHDKPALPIRVSAVLSSSACPRIDTTKPTKPPLKPKPAIDISEKRLSLLKLSPSKFVNEERPAQNIDDEISMHLVDNENVCTGMGIVSIEKYFKYSSLNNSFNKLPVEQPFDSIDDNYAELNLNENSNPEVDLYNPVSVSDGIRKRIGKSYSFCKALTENNNVINQPIISAQGDMRNERVSVSEEREKADETPTSRRSKSVDELDKSILSLLEKDGPYLSPLSHLRMSFIGDLKKKYRTNSIYASTNSSNTTLSAPHNEEYIYSLPQPQCFGDDTLKAVKMVTEKYDSLQRRKMRAISFREGCFNSSPNRSGPTTPIDNVDIIDNLCNLENTVYKRETLGAKDLERVDLFYRSRGTEVHVCQSLADISFGEVDLSGNIVNWEPPKHTGIPVFVLNTGNLVRKRELFIVLAEKGTGFALFRDKINYLSNYKELSDSEHTLLLNSNLRRCIAVKFHSSDSAKQFLNFYKQVAQNPSDELWKISQDTKPSKPKRSWSFRRIKSKLGPDKKNISQPCNFSHMTTINPQIEQLYESLSHLKCGSESGSETNSYCSVPVSR